eukprot:gnl/MRDRNA2_/MRDRNA2_87304_c0_seq1.p1 gnl/MRDRNA2_/MRDRNA2_87304_c0~~gnl/MRDRNA2_/MRDRNA2_87304_c0_seq1.p1  ORF type:complete len:296 (-),score=44.21 gnl/MRDRNA2_/MRDRNA2_87304_c0_seq1:54-839(-)
MANLSIIGILLFAVTLLGNALRMNPPEDEVVLAKQKTGTDSTWMYDALYKQAQKEEGMPQRMPHMPYLVVWPRSFVTKFENLHEQTKDKTRKFNFVGNVDAKDRASVRSWVGDFVKEHFTAENNDMFVNTHNRLSTVGEFDHSTDWVPQSDSGHNLKAVPFDEHYYKVMFESEFTLTPIGDRPYSYRFCEALWAKSIPVVEKASDASCELHKKNSKLKLSPQIGYHFYVRNADPNFKYVYNKTWAEENYAIAKKYHSLMGQ